MNDGEKIRMDTQRNLNLFTGKVDIRKGLIGTITKVGKARVSTYLASTRNSMQELPPMQLV